MSNSYDIFVSYSREDKERVKPIVDQLERQNWAVFMDEQIPGGSVWPEYLARAIDGASIMLVFWSSYAKESAWVRREILYGIQRGIQHLTIVPVCIEAFPLPIELIDCQCIELTGLNHDPSHSRFRAFLDNVALKLKKTVIQSLPQPSSGMGEIFSLLENPVTIVEGLTRVSNEIRFRGSDRSLFEMKKMRYSAGMTDYEKLSWIQEMKVFLSPYVSGL